MERTDTEVQGGNQMKQDVLRLKIIPVNDKYSVGYIEYQNTDVLKRSGFRDRKLDVKSNAFPEWSFEYRTLYLRGTSNERDLLPLIIPNEDVELVENKVKVINEKYGTRWRAEEGGEYQCLNSYGHIETYQDCRYGYNDNHYNSGNYFKTEEEAEEMAEKWRKLFKGEEV